MNLLDGLGFAVNEGERLNGRIVGQDRGGGRLQLLTSDDGCVLLDIEHDRVLKLNSVAAEMWSMLSIGQTESQVAVALSQKYQVGEERVAADVAALAQRIAELGVAQDSIFTPAPETDPQSSSPHPSFPWYGQVSSYSGPKPTNDNGSRSFFGPGNVRCHSFTALPEIHVLVRAAVACQAVEICWFVGYWPSL